MYSRTAHGKNSSNKFIFCKSSAFKTSQPGVFAKAKITYKKNSAFKYVLKSDFMLSGGLQLLLYAAKLLSASHYIRKHSGQCTSNVKRHSDVSTFTHTLY